MDKVSFSFNVDRKILDYIKETAKNKYRTTGAQIEKILYDYMKENQDTEQQRLD